jgi:DNA-directed RNA polymerase subunit H
MAENTIISIQDHVLVPKHIKLTEEKAELILKQYNISKKQLPKIKKTDAAIVHLNANPGDMIEIIRDSRTVGKSNYYRVVV